MKEPQQSNRGIWQFSLKSLMLLMLVATGWLGGWSMAMRHVRKVELQLKVLQLQAEDERLRAQQALEMAKLAAINAATAQRAAQRARADDH